MIVNLQCTQCLHTKKYFLNNSTERPDCCKCGGATKRSALPPSIQVMETLDNGLMAKQVERLSNAPELYSRRIPKQAIE